MVLVQQRCDACHPDRTCYCFHCCRHRRVRNKAVRDTEKNLPQIILDRIQVPASEFNKNVIAAALAQARGGPAKGCRYRNKVNEFLKRYQWDIELKGLNPEIRWQHQEREQNIPDYTALFDHTFCEVATVDELFRSGKHCKFGVKYLVHTTLQGTIINVFGPFPGRTHDFECCKTVQIDGSPMVHYENDRMLADGGYQGVDHRHVAIPVKKPPNGQLNPQQAGYNASIQRYRARVEHTFSCLKGRFKLFARKSQFRDIEKHGRLFKLACVAQNIIQHAANRQRGKYYTCRNIARKNVVYSERGQRCTCCIFPKSNKDETVHY